jgi:hypothetical protein
VGRSYIISHLISPLLFAKLKCLRRVFQRDGIKVIRKIKMDDRQGGEGVYKDWDLTHRYNPSSAQPPVDMCHVPNNSIPTISAMRKWSWRLNLATLGLGHLNSKFRNGMINMALSGQNNEIHPTGT